MFLAYHLFLFSLVQVVASTPPPEYGAGSGYIRHSITRSARDSSGRPNSISANKQAGGLFYTITLGFGTPAQTLSVDIDTGSAELWINPICKTAGDSLCNSFPHFNSSNSSSFNDLGVTSSITYGSGAVDIQYGEDHVYAGWANISSQVFGIANQSQNLVIGILGLGPPSKDFEFGRRSSLLESLVTQGLINSRAFSLDLQDLDSNDSSIIFGGVDTKKYTGRLEKLTTDTGRYEINMTSLSMSFSNGTTTSFLREENAPVLLDSGTSVCAFPSAIFEAVQHAFPGAAAGNQPGDHLFDCAVGQMTGGLDFEFGSTVIRVPYKNFLLPTNEDGKCSLAISSIDGQGVLGDPFLRSAYVVFDQDNHQVHLAQGANCGVNVVPIQSGADSVPSITGAC
ncbi:acid protease [Whalleya microplaca]|nr:acid protease [Whalleya microplaca]